MRKSVRVIALSLCFSVTATCVSYAGSWKVDEKGKWYVNDDGTQPYEQWQEIDGQWYYFNPIGYMERNAEIDGYYLGADGAMFKNAKTPDGRDIDENGKIINSAEGMATVIDQLVHNKLAAKDIESLPVPGVYYSQQERNYPYMSLSGQSIRGKLTEINSEKLVFNGQTYTYDSERNIYIRIESSLVSAVYFNTDNPTKLIYAMAYPVSDGSASGLYYYYDLESAY